MRHYHEQSRERFLTPEEFRNVGAALRNAEAECSMWPPVIAATRSPPSGGRGRRRPGERRAGARSSCATGRETAAITTYITEDHRRAFEALTRREAGNFCLFLCFLSGQPAAAIAAVTVCPPTEEGGKPEYVISPLFVAITEDMVLTDHDGRQA